jgi:predicted outer membrane repeat protein
MLYIMVLVYKSSAISVWLLLHSFEHMLHVCAYTDIIHTELTDQVNASGGALVSLGTSNWYIPVVFDSWVSAFSGGAIYSSNTGNLVFYKKTTFKVLLTHVD